MVTSSDDLTLILELEGWTNDRISAELGVLHTIPSREWVIGRPMSTVIMAAFCHPQPGGGRFNDSTRGAWYAGLTLETALAETIHHRTAELAEVGIFETRVEMRQYLADFDSEFHDIRTHNPEYDPLYTPASYENSQNFAAGLLSDGSNGVMYRSVRHHGGECLACFRPGLVSNVRQGAHYEYRWMGNPTPVVRMLSSSG